MGSRGAAMEPKGYAAGVKKAEEGIYKDSVETAILLDKRGNVIFTESQEQAGYVSFNEEQVKQMKGANLTHNHPSGSTFSKEDIELLTRRELNSIRATGKERTYQLKRISNTRINSSFAGDYETAVNQYKVSHTDKEWATYEKAFKRKAITHAELQKKADELNIALNTFRNEWLKKNAKKYGLIERR